jgi:NRPS condensation-like uncharacterized protein
MNEHPKEVKNKRKLTPLERWFRKCPYSIVTMVVRIIGNISEDKLRNAILKAQKRHFNLRVRIKEDQNHVPWFTSEEVGEIPVKIIPRKSKDDWIKILDKEYEIPFEFHKRPAIRFILVQSQAKSDLIIFCHHIICDGMSLAYLARDLMEFLGDPTKDVETLQKPVPIDLDSMPEDVSLNFLIKFVIKHIINKKWDKERIYFDQKDYEILNESYWENFNHNIISVELSEDQTSSLIERCRKEGVTVNSALSASFATAQYIVKEESFISDMRIAVNLRDRLKEPIGDVMGFYAGIIDLEFNYDNEIGFWENVKIFHKKVKPKYTNKNLFKPFLKWCYLEPSILESIPFKLIGKFLPERNNEKKRIKNFSQQDDLISSILEREKMDSLYNPMSGIAITNLTKLEFPKKYGELELDRLIMNPGGAFPLTLIKMVVGALTCSGKLNIVLEYSEENINRNKMEKIKEKAMDLLFD